MALITETTAAYYGSNNFGNYQFTSLEHIINQFIVAYVGEDKIIPKIKRTDVQFHAMRALQELSFDTFKSCKIQEITLQPSLTMILPIDYVNYTKLTWSDSSGIEHIIYPTSKTSNPTTTGNLVVDGTSTGANDNFTLGDNWSYLDNQISGNVASASTPDRVSFAYPFVNNRRYRVRFTLSQPPRDDQGVQNAISGFVQALLYSGDSYVEGPITTATSILYNTTLTVGNDGATPTTGVFSGVTDSFVIQPSTDFTGQIDNIVVTDITLQQDIVSTTWANYSSTTPSENQDDYQDDTYWPAGGERYGLDPQHAQANGSFFIDCNTGKIHFSSNLNGKTIILHYLSDSLGTPDEMRVHKFAEEAMYKWIAYAILSTSSSQLHQQLAPRFKRERFAEIRKAKLRLSNIKLEEITQILRGKSKQIKH